MTILIGLCGPAGSGKSTIAQYLVDRYGAKRYSFAAPLKEFAKRVFDFSDEQLYGTQAQKEAVDERYGHSPRWFLQRLGTEGFRGTFGEDFWADHLLKRVAHEYPELAVVEDCRFVNEAKAIRSYNRQSWVWKLLPLKTNSTADPTHASEQGWLQAPYDHIIQPTEYGLPGLYKLIDNACREFTIMPIGRPVGY